MISFNNNSVQTEQLRQLIGAQVRYLGVRWEIIEILEDGPALVLSDCEHHTVIQPDQHGEAHRRVPSTLTVPLYSHDGHDINPAVQHLELLETES